jgi:ABC-type transport system involved in multi-copper enzyme maturation permease subunit
VIQKTLEEVKETYVANPVATRSFRTQMRGRKAPILWGLYAAIVVLAASLMYSLAIANGAAGIGEIQARLAILNGMMLTLLAVAVTLVAPAISVSQVVSEYDRRSMDLILSSPLSLRAFFLGKLISSWRVVWMILLLALPVSSMSLVMGGSTLFDVLLGYLMVSMAGLAAAAISIPISVQAKKTVPALLGSYLAVMAGAVAVTYAVAWFSMVSGTPGTGRDLLSGQWSLILATAVSGFAGLLVTWLSLAGAAAILSRKGAREEWKLRIGGLVSAALAAGGISTAASALIMWQAEVWFQSHQTGVMIYLWAAVVAGFLPSLGTFDWNGEAKRAPSGTLSLKEAFSGGTKGGLPYLMILFGVGAVALTLPVHLLLGQAHTMIQPAIWSALALLWGHSCFRLASSISQVAGDQPKLLGVGLAVVLGFLPLPLVSFPQVPDSGIQNSPLFWLAPMSGPMLADPTAQVLNLMVLAASALGLNLLARRLRLKREAQPLEAKNQSSPPLPRGAGPTLPS